MERFEVVTDPRIEAEGIGPAEVTTQAYSALAVRDAVTRARKAADQIDEALQELEQGEPSGRLEGGLVAGTALSATVGSRSATRVLRGRCINR
jgi:hypothetical protein